MNSVAKVEKLSIREGRYIEATAQCIILDHIRIWVAFKLWGLALKDEPILPMVDIPTIEDYENLKKIIVIGLKEKRGERGIPITLSSGHFYFISVPNFRIISKNEKLIRREDKLLYSPDEIPLVRCLITTHEALTQKFKSRNDFKKIIKEIRAISLGFPLEKELEKRKKRKNKTYVDYLEVSNWSNKKKEIARYKRSNNYRPSKEKTVLQKIIKDYFYNDREYFNKIRQRLQQDGLILKC